MVAAHDELPAEDAHRRGHRLAHHRLARARDEAAQHAAQIARRGLGLDDAPGEHERPGRGVDEGRIGLAEMLLPIGAGDLVADQPVDGLGIGNAQQRLGKAHEGDALLRGQRVFVQEGVDAALADTLPAHRDDEKPRRLGDAIERRGRQLRRGQDLGDDGALVGPVVLAQAQPERIGRRRLSKDKGGGRAGHLPSLRGPPIHTGKSRAPHATRISSSKPSRLARQDRMGPTAPMESTGPASLGFASPSPPRYHQHAETGHPETVRRGHIIRYYRV